MKIIYLLLLPLFLSGQFIGENPYQNAGIPYFYLNLNRSYQHNETFIIVKMAIANNDLTFKRDSAGYYAKYHFTLFIFPEGSDISIGYIDREYELHVKNFHKTNDGEIFNEHNYDIDLEPGIYRIESLIRDLNNGKEVMRKNKITIEDLTEKGILLSDIIFYKIDKNREEKTIVSEGVFTRDQKDVEIYIAYTTNDDKTPIHFTTEYLDENNKNFYSFDSTINPELYGNLEFALNSEDFPKGYHIIKLTVSQNNNFHAVLKDISFSWTTFPETEFEMNKALKAMIYIAPKDSIYEYLEKDFLSKSDYFKRFWLKLDPTNDTANNELMEEYFARVKLAEQEFSSHGNPGYKTDFGRIFIKYGQPDRVEFVSRDKSRGIWAKGLLWEYYEFRKKFLFVNGTLHYKYLIYETD